MKAFEVKYVGPGSGVTERHLLAKDEKKKGLVLPGNLSWTRDNRHTLILKELHETAQEFFKSGPHSDEFKLKEIDVPDDFFDDDDVAAKSEDLEAAKAAEEADSGPETVNAETSGLDSTPTTPRASRARRS